MRTSHAIKEARTENWKQQQGDENNIKENSLELESFSKLLSQLSQKSHLYTFVMLNVMFSCTGARICTVAGKRALPSSSIDYRRDLSVYSGLLDA